MRCPCADSMLIILLGLATALVGTIRIVAQVADHNLHPVYCCLGMLFLVLPLCWVVFETCGKLEEMHGKLLVQAAQPPRSRRDEENDNNKNKRPSTANNHPVKPPVATQKEIKREELGVSLYHLKKIVKKEVRKLHKRKIEEEHKAKTSPDNNTKTDQEDNAKKFKNIAEKDFEDVNIYDIVDDVIKAQGSNVICPRDGEVGAAYVDCLKGKDHVGKANIMLSYAWANSIVDIVDVVEQLCTKLGMSEKEAYIWICSFCNNQHRFGKQKTFDELQEIFKSQVVGIGTVLCLMSPYNNPHYVNRAWCVFEFDTAENSEETETHIMLPSRERQKMIEEIICKPEDGEEASRKLFDILRLIKIEDAEATKEEDKKNILQLVELNGGAAKLNMAVNDKFREWQTGVVKEGCESLKSKSKSKDVATDLDLARSLNNAGVIFTDRGYFAEAMESLTKSLEIRERVHGRDHPDTASTHCYIARVYFCQGKNEDALESYFMALEIQEKKLGNDHGHTVSTYNDIANVYSGQGKCEDALEYYHKAVTIYEKVLGKDHQHTATTYHNIAVVYRKQGKFKDALEYYHKAISIHEKVLGKDHQDTATTYGNMASIYSNQGKYEDALEYYHKAVTIKEKLYGKDHQSTAATYSNMASVYSYQGKYQDALEYYHKAITICEKVLGKDHQYTAITYFNMAYTYERQGDLSNALPYYEKCLAARENIYGKDHSETQSTKSAVARVTQELNETE